LNKYEILCLLENSLTDDNKAKLVDKFIQVVENAGGKIVNVDKWGTRKFAYEIDHKTEGYYFLINAEAEPTLPAEFQRQMNITEGAMRSMIVKKDEFSVKKVRRTEKKDEVKDAEYGAPVKDGIDPEFGKVTNSDITADQMNESVSEVLEKAEAQE
jgi:small subunit ribosomal protein S6